MCGIVGYIGPQDPVEVIVEGLRRLEYRGYDSAGVAVVGEDGEISIRRASGKLRDLEKVIARDPLSGRFGPNKLNQRRVERSELRLHPAGLGRGRSCQRTEDQGEEDRSHGYSTSPAAEPSRTEL